MYSINLLKPKVNLYDGSRRQFVLKSILYFFKIDTYIDKLRRRMRMSVEENDQSELRKVLCEMRKLQLASVQPDIKFAEEELVYILIKKGKDVQFS